MDEHGTTRGRPMPEEAAARFVVVVQGAAPEARVVEGLEGVKAAVLQAIWREPGEVALEAVADLAGSLGDPEAWAGHGAGDGRPYWHWWFGFEGGSVTVQRLTAAPPSPDAGVTLQAAIAEAVAVLADSVQDLRRLGRAGDGGGYVFSARRPSPG